MVREATKDIKASQTTNIAVSDGLFLSIDRRVHPTETAILDAPHEIGELPEEDSHDYVKTGRFADSKAPLMERLNEKTMKTTKNV